MSNGMQVRVPYSPHNLTMWVDETKEKAPKLRFKPGMVFVYEGEIILVQAAFRLQKDDREWLYQCNVLSRSVDEEAKRQALLRVAHYTPQSDPSPVVYWLFRNSLDAFTYFGYLPHIGDGRILSNKELIQMGERLIETPVPVE